VYFTLGCGRHAPLSLNIAVIVEATPRDGAALLGGDGLPVFSLNIFAIGWCANFVEDEAQMELLAVVVT